MKEHFCGVDSMFTDTPRKKKTTYFTGIALQRKNSLWAKNS